MRKLTVFLALMVLAGVTAGAQYHYAFYYDATGGQDVEVNVLNTMPTNNSIALSVHDAYGAEIWSFTGELDGNGAGFISIGDYVSGADYAWGVVTVDSVERVVIGVEYFLDGEIVSIDTIDAEVPVLDPSEPFWLGTYYNQVGDASTAFIVMNPWASTASCTITAYNSNGGTVYDRDFVLGPYESEYVPLGDSIGSGTLLWGLLDVQMEGRAVILGLEYSGRGAGGLEIDNITEYYF